MASINESSFLFSVLKVDMEHKVKQNEAELSKMDGVHFVFGILFFPHLMTLNQHFCLYSKGFIFAVCWTDQTVLILDT